MRLGPHNTHTGPMLAWHYNAWWLELDDVEADEDDERICDEVRRTGRLDAGSMWEAPFSSGPGNAPLGVLEPEWAEAKRRQNKEWASGREERRKLREAAREARKAKYAQEAAERAAAEEQRRAAVAEALKREQELYAAQRQCAAEQEARRRRQAQQNREQRAAWLREYQRQHRPWEPPEALAEAQAWWSQRNPHYATQAFHYVSPCKGGVIQTDGVTVTFTTGQGQWVPYVIAVSIWSGGG